MTGLLFPKKGKTKRKTKHKDSILQNRDGRCFLCILKEQDARYHGDLERHHVFGGPDRTFSEEEGLTVYLCPRHHRTGSEAVHTNKEMNLLVKRYAQAIWEQTHTREEFMARARKNYL